MSKYIFTLAVLILSHGFSIGFLELSHAATEPGKGSVVSARKKIQLIIGRSEIVKFKNRIERISISNSKVVEAIAVTPHEMLLNGKGPGTASVVVWNNKGAIYLYQVNVGENNALLQRIREHLAKVIPNEKISIEQIGQKIAMSGVVSSKEAKKVALNFGEAYAPKRVVDNIQVNNLLPQVLLKVRFAEISKSGALDVGLGFIRRSNDQNNIGYFPGAGGFAPSGPFLPPVTGLPGPDLTFSGVINFFLASGSRSAGLFLRLLQEKGYIHIISEPHLRVVSGKKAEFLVGGEVPVPVPGQDGQVTILYRPFGIQLEFTPIVKKSGYIDLEVKPSFSAIDPSLNVVIQGFNVPGFKASNTKTRVDLKSGQTMAISGLVSEETRKNIAQTPFLGDIPILGQLFQSKSFQEDKTELVLLITPQIIRPQRDGDLKLTRSGFMVGRIPKLKAGNNR